MNIPKMRSSSRTRVFPTLALLCLCTIATLMQDRNMAMAFVHPARGRTQVSRNAPTSLNSWNGNNKDEAAIEEEARIRIYESRRMQIRGTLKSAESLRNFRIANDLIPELDEDGKPIKSDGKLALSATAFVVAAGAIALRVGGRAALISTIGLDFITENPDLQNQMNQILEFSDSMDILTKLGLFCLAWTVIKVSCFDAGAIALALSSGILFGGVLQGAVVSAFGATVGSSAAFGLAKLDTPVRKKALEIVEDNPSLRGIEKVVAKDGLKAILTLRLAPILPIPIGFYNYVYGVTNVPYLDFAGGIFLGSMKPYLLDSYLGYFGKTLVDGSASQDGGLQDIILLTALGVSVLIGVFASQLASETWDTVLEEIKAEEAVTGKDKPDDDKIMREIFGLTLPQWIVGFQLALKEAEVRVNGMIDAEVAAKAWNYTKSDGDNPVPRTIDPAKAVDSPEMLGVNKGIDYGGSLCEGLVLSPCLFSIYLTLADPLYDEAEAAKAKEAIAAEAATETTTTTAAAADSVIEPTPSTESSANAILTSSTALSTDTPPPAASAASVPTKESLRTLSKDISDGAKEKLVILSQKLDNQNQGSSSSSSSIDASTEDKPDRDVLKI